MGYRRRADGRLDVALGRSAARTLRAAEEMPAEEGFPAYLADAAGRNFTSAPAASRPSAANAVRSASSARSRPPGGDFSEPVTQHTKRFIRCFWALDKELAARALFPGDQLAGQLQRLRSTKSAPGGNAQYDAGWRRLRAEAMDLLQEDSRAPAIVRLVGEDALPDEQRLILEGSRLLAGGFLQQNAFDPIDRSASRKSNSRCCGAVLHFVRARPARGGQQRRADPIGCASWRCATRSLRAKEKIANDELDRFEQLTAQDRRSRWTRSIANSADVT